MFDEDDSHAVLANMPPWLPDSELIELGRCLRHAEFFPPYQARLSRTNETFDFDDTPLAPIRDLVLAGRRLCVVTTCIASLQVGH